MCQVSAIAIDYICDVTAPCLILGVRNAILHQSTEQKYFENGKEMVKSFRKRFYACRALLYITTRFEIADIDDDFIDEVGKLKIHISQNIRPNMSNCMPLTGEKMVQICRIYAENITADESTQVLSLNQVPCILISVGTEFSAFYTVLPFINS